MKRSKNIKARISIIFLLILTVFSNSYIYSSESDSINIGNISTQQAVMQDIYVKPTPEPNITSMNIDFEITDSVCHPSKPILYITSYKDKKLYALNHETAELSSIAFELPPETVTFENNEIYVALIKRENENYSEDNEEGAVAIINPDSFQLVDQFDVNIDPFEIVVDKNGYLHIISAANISGSIKSFSRETKKEIGYSTISIPHSYASMHPIMNRIYSNQRDSGFQEYTVFDISNDGKFVSHHSSNYYTKYKLTDNFRISPDGKYNFNSSGLILSCDEDSTKDLSFVHKLYKQFIDIAFDLDNNRFYTAIANKQVYVYEYNTFNGLDIINTKGYVEEIFYNNGSLLALSKSEDNKWMFEKITLRQNPVSSPTLVNSTPTPTFIPSVTPTMKNDYITIGKDVTKTAINTENNILYYILLIE